MHVIYGLLKLEEMTPEEIDAERVNPRAHEYAEMGRLIYDPKFDSLRNAYSQRYFLATCDELRQLELVGGGPVNCWLENFKTWLEKRGDQRSQQDKAAGHVATIPYLGDPQFFLDQLRIWAFETEMGRFALLESLIAFDANRTHLVHTKIVADGRESLQRNNATKEKLHAYK